MASPQRIFGVVRLIGNEPTGVAPLTGSIMETTIAFANGRTARLFGRDVRSTGLAELLKEASAAQVPVLVELDDTGTEVADVQVPLPGDGVSSILEADPQALEVELVLSQARHRLRRDNPNFEELRRRLEVARTNGMKVFVTTSDDLGIVHVEETGLPFALEAAPDVKLFAAPPSITLAEAEALFSRMAETSCNPHRPAGACITFLYPDDGCYARAHEMCRLIGPSRTGKAWIYGSLVARTRNHPDCHVNWRYHVAPTVPVKLGAAVIPHILDPSLFAKPVPIATWKGAQGDASANVIETDAEPFYRSQSGSIQADPNYAKTNQALTNFRLLLRERSAKKGAPPYANCPATMLDSPVA